MEIGRGDVVAVRTAFGTMLERVALRGVEKGHDFPVVWVTTREEWEAAKEARREPEGLPWPADDVQQADESVMS